MSFEEAHSSWHPALMPNSLADLVAHHAASNPPSEQEAAVAPILEADRELNFIKGSKELRGSNEAAPEPVSVETTEEHGDVAGIIRKNRPITPEREENDEYPELTNLRSALETSLASPGGLEMDERPKHAVERIIRENDGDIPVQSSLTKANFPSKGPANQSGHMSSVSFARTVPKEMDWGEDDEVGQEWNPQPRDPDPFQTMAPLDRTNSFPAVPPQPFAVERSISTDAAFRHASQAADKTQPLNDLFGNSDAGTDDFFPNVAEPETESNHEAERQQEDWFNNHGGQSTNDDFDRSFGGDVVDESDFEARYEEGIPLIADAEQKNGASKYENGSFEFFGDEDPSQEDDFFSGARHDEITYQNRHHHQNQPSLERKSTMSVMNSMHFQPHNHTSPSAETEDTKREALPSVAKESTAVSTVPGPSEEDLAAKWKAALDGDEFLDDEELLDDEPAAESSSLDPAIFFGSDDEGFLEDDEPSAEPALEFVPSPAAPEANGHARKNSASRYFPPNATQPQAPISPTVNPYKPAALLLGDFSKPALPTSSPYGQGYGDPAPRTIPPYNNTQQPPRPDMPKSQSFADKSKGGYSSPYDLPMEVVKPRKRVSMQQMTRNYNNSAPPPVAAPPRSSSMFTQAPPPSRGSQVPPPSRGSNSSLSPPLSTQQLHQPGQSFPLPVTATQPAPPALRSKSSFFEELPTVAKPKPAGRYTPRPVSPIMDPRALQGSIPFQQPVDPRATQGSVPYQQPPDHQAYQSHATYTPAGPASAPPQPDAPFSESQPPVQGLIAPPRDSPYANISSGPPHSIIPSNRYSPAPSHSLSGNTSPPPLAQGRYATAPSNIRQLPSQTVGTPAAPQAIFPHQPRTSSPLAHFERSHDHHSYSGPGPLTGGVAMLRRGSSGFDHVSRAPSLPMTREVDEKEPNDGKAYGAAMHSNITPQQQFQHNYANSGIPSVSQHAQEYQHDGSLSPAKRMVSGSVYGGQHGSVKVDHGFAPPQRSQTQSPSRVMSGSRADIGATEPYQRPVSVHGPASPKQIAPEYLPMVASMVQEAPKTRPRGFSQGYSYIAPTDGRERDPLQRWRGGPVFAWGVGGTVITSFPKEVPRYGIGQAQPQIMVSPGEVKTRSLKDIYPLDERLASFPGPLKSKVKKKETMAWLTAGIDILDHENQYLRSLVSLSHENKRREERVVLWKILRVMIENDGLLEGNDTVNGAVRAVLSPGLNADANGAPPQYATGAELTGIVRAAGSTTHADPVNPAAVEQLRMHLLRGEREKAVWEAVDKRLWAHAMLISNTLSKDLYKQVAQEFVQKEIQSIGENTESLAALYEVFAGNFEESVDELVPPSARAGFQMVSTSGSGPSKSSLDGLDRWRETLGLVLSNRSENDSQAINALGKLLSGYGRAEAAHICFIFGRSHSVFDGFDNPLSTMVLIGSDHHRQRYEFDKELEPILLSEVYEFGLTLSNTSNIPLWIPHLSVYKLLHATVLAQFGQREKALQYCEAIASSITSQTRRSPYHHSLLVAALDDLSKRLKQSPKDESSSWISKPSIDKVSTSVWSKFNKFVAGDESDAAAAPGSENGSDIGPFARIAGGTPTISRSPSNAELHGSYTGGPANGAIPPAPATRAASRYAPGGAYTPPSSSHEPPVSVYGSPPHQSTMGQRQSFEDRRLFEEPRAPILEMSTGSYQGDSLHPAQPAQTSTGLYNSYAPQGQASYKSSSQPHTPTFEQSHSPSMRGSPQSVSNYERPAPIPGYGTPDSFNPNSGQIFNTQTHNEFEPQSAGSYGPPIGGGYQTPSNTDYEPPRIAADETRSSSGYEPPSSSGYEPPSYEPNVMDDEPDSPNTRPKKKSFIDDDFDGPSTQPLAQSKEKSKAEKDREAEEAFRRAAEADAQKDAPAAMAKKGWGLGGWFGGKKEPAVDTPQPNKPIKAKLGEESSFVYDPELKRWINKKAGKDGAPERQTATPPPPKGPPRTASGPPGSAPTSAPRPALPPSFDSAPPPQQRSVSAANPLGPLSGSAEHLAVAPPMSRTVSSGSASGPPSAPPSRPATSMSNASSIDDLLGPPAARKGGAKKAKKGRGYIDVMGDKK